MQAIRTRYHGPTNSTGACIRAKCEAGAIRMPYRHELNTDENHKAACSLLVKKLGWDTEYYGDMVGGVFDGDHYWVSDDKRLKALRAFVNSMRKGSWSGSPWGYPEFRACVATIGRAFGFHGNSLNAPTTDEEIATFTKKV